MIQSQLFKGFPSPYPRLARIFHLPLLLGALVVLFTPACILGQVRLEIVEIKHGDHFIEGATYHINNRGQIAASKGEVTAIWKRGTKTQFIHAIGHDFSLRINDTGSIIGQKGYTDYTVEPPMYYSELPYIWNEESGYQYIPTENLYASGTITRKQAKDINNLDVVIGTCSALESFNGDPSRKGWIWTSETGTTEIPNLIHSSESQSTSPNAINDHNVIVGEHEYKSTINDRYYHVGFIYDHDTGIRSLQSIDHTFFSPFLVIPTDINNSNVIIGFLLGLTSNAFVYDFSKRSGITLSGFSSGLRGNSQIFATSINNLGCVVGISEDWERASPEENQRAPFIWNPETGIARITDFTTFPFQSILPTGVNIEDAKFYIGSINDHGQISGILTINLSSPSFYLKIPFVLYPTLTYRFELKEIIERHKENILVFSHPKKLDENSLSPSHFGKRIVHESSIDAKTWQPLTHGVNGVEIVDNEEELQIRLPEQPSVFIRSRMVDNVTNAD